MLYPDELLAETSIVSERMFQKNLSANTFQVLFISQKSLRLVQKSAKNRQLKNQDIVTSR